MSHPEGHIEYFHSMLWPCLWVALGLSICFAMMAFIFDLRLPFRESDERLSRISSALIIGFLAALVPFGAAAVFIALDMAQHVMPTLVRWISQTADGNRVGFAIGCSIMAFLLFVLRKYGRIAYSIVEIVTGIVGLLAFREVPSFPGSVLHPVVVTWLVAQMTLIYVIVRGLDNLDIGLRERRERRYAGEPGSDEAPPGWSINPFR